MSQIPEADTQKKMVWKCSRYLAWPGPAHGILSLKTWVAIAFWPAGVAHRKGHNLLGFMILGPFLLPVALVLAPVVDDRSGALLQ
jgi:hypothetical protein